MTMPPSTRNIVAINLNNPYRLFRNGAHIGNELNYPAAFGNTVSVAAVDGNKKWAFFR
jgi:hypothetical protein